MSWKTEPTPPPTPRSLIKGSFRYPGRDFRLVLLVVILCCSVEGCLRAEILLLKVRSKVFKQGHHFRLPLGKEKRRKVSWGLRGVGWLPRKAVKQSLVLFLSSASDKEALLYFFALFSFFLKQHTFNG